MYLLKTSARYISRYFNKFLIKFDNDFLISDTTKDTYILTLQHFVAMKISYERQQKHLSSLYIDKNLS